MNWIRALLNRRQLDADLAEEIRSHVAERTDALVEEGLSPHDALDRARREFGNATVIEERGRAVWRWARVEDAWADARSAVRQLRRTPSFTLAAVVTLALGVGANVVVFSVIQAVLLAPLPFPDAGRLVSVRLIDQRDVAHPDAVSYPIFFDFRRGTRTLDHLVSFRDDEMTLTGRGEPVKLPGQIVSWDLFPALGVSPALGRGFTAGEEQKGQHVVVLGHELWTERFGADRAIVGRAVTLDGEPYTVVGVAPSGFNFPVLARQVQVPGRRWPGTRRATPSPRPPSSVAPACWASSATWGPARQWSRPRRISTGSMPGSPRRTRTRTGQSIARTWSRCSRAWSGTPGCRCSSCSGPSGSCC